MFATSMWCTHFISEAVTIISATASAFMNKVPKLYCALLFGSVFLSILQMCDKIDYNNVNCIVTFHVRACLIQF
jgi:hypothetical protein